MNKETRNLITFFLGTFAATWISYFIIVFNCVAMERQSKQIPVVPALV